MQIMRQKGSFRIKLKNSKHQFYTVGKSDGGDKYEVLHISCLRRCKELANKEGVRILEL